MAVDPELLRGQPLLEPLEEGQLRRVATAARRRNLESGERLFEQGAPAEAFYLVREGAVKLARLSEAGGEKVVEVIRAGQTFAEAVMFMEGERYPVAAEATAPTELIAFDNAAFRREVAASPELALRLLAALSRRLHGLVAEIDELSFHSATHRLVGYLLAEAREGRVRLAAPKQVIASRLGVTPETLSRTLARLREEGLVRVEGDTVDLIDADALAARAAGSDSRRP